MGNKKVLFILKRREDYNKEKHTKVGVTTGLYNSASFMNDMLNESDVESNLSVVIDNNQIDREVTKYRPTHVIIEALWVVPSKFSVLCKLHPDVKWIIRLHSEIPFLANEGMALDWIADYPMFKNLYIAANSPRAMNDIRFYVGHKMKWNKEECEEKIIYLPNFYPQNYLSKDFDRNKEFLDIGCFGAIRPLKNHLLQALASIKFADSIGKKLRFHINSGRIEMNGSPVLHNLQNLFVQLNERGHELVNHEWADREDFLELCRSMDIGVQCSLSETFNIVGADIISQGVPLVASSEIPWINPKFCGRPVESEEIVEALLKTYSRPEENVITNQSSLKSYTDLTRTIWIKYFDI